MQDYGLPLPLTALLSVLLQCLTGHPQGKPCGTESKCMLLVFLVKAAPWVHTHKSMQNIQRFFSRKENSAVPIPIKGV